MKVNIKLVPDTNICVYIANGGIVKLKLKYKSHALNRDHQEKMKRKTLLKNPS